tara:strand:- start:1402 stop:1950 length:549 start_codon:yes stop_codon:yes gene_type:complete
MKTYHEVNKMKDGLQSGPSEVVKADTINVSDDLTVADTLTVTGAATLSSTLAVTGATTQTVGCQSAAVSRVPTVDGTGTGLIADGTSMVVVTDGADANTWLTLPTPTPGNIVWLMTSGESTGFEIRSSAPATVGINGGTGAGVESAVAAAITLIRCVCVSATEWICSQFDADGDESKLEVAA